MKFKEKIAGILKIKP